MERENDYSVDSDSARSLLTSDCWLLEFKKLISHEPDDETRFPDSSVTEKDQFKVTNTVAHVDCCRSIASNKNKIRYYVVVT